MQQTNDIVNKAYGNKLRVRVCGICFQDEKILLVKHKHLGETGILWAPPGGGMEFGESAEDALIREFKEETNLTIEVSDFLFVHEYLDPPLHGIELFFLVKVIAGDVKLGSDPEMPSTDQILTEASFQDLKTLQMAHFESLHYVLQETKNIQTLINQKGYFKFH